MCVHRFLQSKNGQNHVPLGIFKKKKIFLLNTILKHFFMLCTSTSMVILKLLLDSFYIHTCNCIVGSKVICPISLGRPGTESSRQLYTLRDDAPVLWHLNHHKHNNYVLES